MISQCLIILMPHLEHSYCSFLYCDRGTLNLLGPSGKDSICRVPPIVLLGTVARF